MTYPEKQDAHSAAQALLIIEPGLVSILAKKNLPEAELSALDSLNEQMMNLANSENQHKWQMLDRYFHIKLVNNSDCSEVKLLTCSFLNRLNRKPNPKRLAKDMIRSVNEHKAIVQCLREQDSTLAFKILQLHRMRQIAKRLY